MTRCADSILQLFRGSLKYTCIPCQQNISFSIISYPSLYNNIEIASASADI